MTSPSLRLALILAATVTTACTDDPIPSPAPAPATATAAPSVGLGGSWSDERKAFVWEVTGLDPKDLAALAVATRNAKDWPRFFSVQARPIGTEAAAGNPPLFGSARVEGDRLQFQTRFRPDAGMTYDFLIDLTALPGRPSGRSYEISFDLVATGPPAAPSAVVRRVAPASDLLPENALKFYIEFSAPMSRGEAYDHVRLLDDTGKPIDLPFLELGEELWDRRGERFTLLFDPGRIKSGLKPREEDGPVLVAGKTYTLAIDRGWHDANGIPLKADFRKTFRAGPADTTPPDPKTWILNPAAAGRRAPLVVTFPEPLDRAMLGRVLTVIDAAGKRVAGAVAVGDDETSWSFTPEAPWAAGRYRLVADRTLEDRAGNSIARPFEVDVFRKVERRAAVETVELPFTVVGG